MDRVDLGHLRVRSASRLGGWLRLIPALLPFLFCVAWLLVLTGLTLPAHSLGTAQWPDAALLLLAVAVLSAGLTRQVPGQNVALVYSFLLVAGAGLHALSQQTGIPFGIRIPGGAMGNQLLWVIPMIWAAALLSSRGVARLALAPIRHKPAYGYWLLGTSVGLSLLFELALEPFATCIKRMWSWAPANTPGDWYGTPWVSFFGWTVTALLFLAFITPALINKSPVQRPPDYFPFWVWSLLKMVFAAAAATHQLWGVAILATCEIVAVSGLLLHSRKKIKPVSIGTVR